MNCIFCHKTLIASPNSTRIHCDDCSAHFTVIFDEIIFLSVRYQSLVFWITPGIEYCAYWFGDYGPFHMPQTWINPQFLKLFHDRYMNLKAFH